MFNSIKKITSKYTGLLIRMDDIAENMNWALMDKCEKLFDKFKLKPLLGIIPINKDPDLLKFPKNDRFWERVKVGKIRDGRLQCMAAITFILKNQIKMIFLIMEVIPNFTV